MSHQAFLALGSNLGDREGLLQQALVALNGHPKIDVTQVSRFYETEPIGMRSDEPAEAFINAVAALTTSLAPQALLAVCLEIEQQLGRNRTQDIDKQQGHTSRTLDVDILFYDDRVIREDGLEIPHPRLHQRAFVLTPLCEIAPDWHHPVLQQTIRQLQQCLETQLT